MAKKYDVFSKFRDEVSENLAEISKVCRTFEISLDRKQEEIINQRDNIEVWRLLVEVQQRASIMVNSRIVHACSNVNYELTEYQKDIFSRGSIYDREILFLKILSSNEYKIKKDIADEIFRKEEDIELRREVMETGWIETFIHSMMLLCPLCDKISDLNGTKFKNNTIHCPQCNADIVLFRCLKCNELVEGKDGDLKIGLCARCVPEGELELLDFMIKRNEGIDKICHDFLCKLSLQKLDMNARIIKKVRFEMEHILRSEYGKTIPYYSIATDDNGKKYFLFE